MGATTVEDSDFQEVVLGESAAPVVVYFWAEWCGPCKKLSPLIDEIANEQADVIKVVKMNVDQNPQTAQALGVRGIPTMIVFRHGEPTKRLVGTKPKPLLLAELLEIDEG